MLLLQRQNLLNIRSLAKRCVLVSLAVHLVVIFMLLFVYKDYHQRLIVDLGKKIPSAAVVKILPLSMKMPENQRLGVKGGKGKEAAGIHKQNEAVKLEKAPTIEKASVTTVPAQVKKLSEKKSKKSKPQTVIAEKNKKKTSLKNKLAEQKKKKLELKNQKKALVQKELEEKKQKKIEEQKKLDAKKVAPSESVNADLKKLDHIEKPVEPAVIESSKPGTPLESVTTGQDRVTEQPEGQEFIYVTQQEFDVLQLQQKLQTCLFDRWTPPLGVPETAICQAVVSIGWDGALVEVEYLKKSSIHTYDMSVQETLDHVEFPHEVWGKRITITFKP